MKITKEDMDKIMEDTIYYCHTKDVKLKDLDESFRVHLIKNVIEEGENLFIIGDMEKEDSFVKPNYKNDKVIDIIHRYITMSKNWPNPYNIGKPPVGHDFCNSFHILADKSGAPSLWRFDGQDYISGTTSMSYLTAGEMFKYLCPVSEKVTKYYEDEVVGFNLREKCTRFNHKKYEDDNR